MDFISCIKLLTIAIILTGSPNSADNQHLQQNQLMDLINDLNTQLNMKWNAVIALEIQQDVESVINCLKIPVVIITEKYDEADIHLRHSHQFMAIVYIERSTLKKIYAIAEQFLASLQFTQILFIFPEADTEEDLRSLAKINWHSGFVKVLYYTQQGLFTYQPIPLISIQRNFNVREYTERKEVVDFQQYPLAMPILHVPPRCYRFKNRFGARVTTGYMYKIINTFIKQYNFRFKEVKILKSDAAATKYLIEGVNNRTIDILPLVFYTIDHTAGSSSDVLWNMKFRIVAPYPAAIPRSKYIQLPFTMAATICILLLLLVCVAAVSFIYFMQNQRDEFDFGKSFLYVLSLFTYQSQIDVKVKTILQKLLYILIFLPGFILTNLYLAKLSSLLVTNIYEPKMQTLADLNGTELKMVIHDSHYNYLHKLSNVTDDILKQTKSENYSRLYIIQRNLDNKHLLLLTEDKLSFLIFQQQYLKIPKVYVIDDVLSEFPVYFTVRRNLPYLQLFNRYLERIRESGILSKFMLETNLEGILSGEIRFFKETAASGVSVVNFEFFLLPFCYFFISLCVAFVVFIFELIYFKFAKKRCAN